MANLRAEYQKLNDEAAAQKAAAGGRVNTALQAKLDASRAALAGAEASTAEAWNKITATNKTKISNAIVQMQTNTTSFNQALTTQADSIAKAIATARDKVNAANLTPAGVKTLSELLPDDRGKTPEIKKPAGTAYGSANPRFASSLGGAIAFENAHKPSGSSLVIANSSETVIPAAGGYGMSDLMGTLTTGFYNLTQYISSIQNNLTRSIEGNEQKSERKFNTLTEKLTEMSQQITKLSTMQGGSMLGIGGGGNIVSVGQQLLAMGLQVGENPYFQYGAGYLPGGGGRVGQHAKGSYHYLGRALDVSGSVAQLNQVYAMLKGTNPSELLWQVPGHYDHLHVAYGLGKGNPAFFGSQAEAMAWEKQMMPPTAKVQSFTSNTSEGFGNNGGNVSISAPITIYQQPGQSPKELAALVAMEISNAVADVRNSSYYV
jgi:hypothetical protein